ncbi:MAG TPA: site-2 protease family protein, partial [Gemmatimonadales bacterium]|nr:site-2 protease family protein [Gemmatimonadales bacterium]
MLLTIASLIIVLGILISVHEFGHFIVAKAVGIQVLRFSLGFGRPLFQWQRGETEYWVSWIPLGGYVKMAGLEEEGMVGELEGGKATVPIDPARAFDQKPLWARMAVILAGVTMNLFLAFVIFTGLVAIAGAPRAAVTPVDSVPASRLPPGAAALATVRRGDIVTRINGDSLKTWDDFEEKVIEGPEELRFTVAGRPAPIVVQVPRD